MLWQARASSRLPVPHLEHSRVIRHLFSPRSREACRCGASYAISGFTIVPRQVECSRMPGRAKGRREFSAYHEEERHIDPGCPRKHEANEQRADGGARGPSDAGDPGRRRPFVLAHDRLGVGLPLGNIHLADAESWEKHQHRQRKIGHQRHKYEQNVGGKMREDHGVNQAPARRETSRQECGNPRKEICFTPSCGS